MNWKRPSEFQSVFVYLDPEHHVVCMRSSDKAKVGHCRMLKISSWKRQTKCFMFIYPVRQRAGHRQDDRHPTQAVH